MANPRKIGGIFGELLKSVDGFGFGFCGRFGDEMMGSRLGERRWVGEEEE